MFVWLSVGQDCIAYILLFTYTTLLPVNKRILLKLLSSLRLDQNGFSPAYINVLLKQYISTRTVRTSSLRSLTVTSVTSKSCVVYETERFSIAHQKMEQITRISSTNSIVESLKTKMKRYLFNL